jgi:hypothetical protein
VLSLLAAQPAPGLLISVAEHAGWLTPEAPRFAQVAFDGTAVPFALNQLQGGLFEAGANTFTCTPTTCDLRDPPAARSGFAAVLSGIENVVFVIGGQLTSNVPANDVWMFSLRFSSWSRLLVHAGSFGVVMAATYRPEDRSLYVIDEVKTGPDAATRLVRISVGTGDVTVLGSWDVDAKRDAIFVSNAPQGDLLVTASRSKKTRWKAFRVHLDGDNSPHVVVAHAGGRGAIALPPTLSDRGLTVPVFCPLPVASPQTHHDDGDDDGKDDGQVSCSGARNLFVPASRMHFEKHPEEGDAL